MPDAITFADRCGQLAPSVHNCRPADAPLVFIRNVTQYQYPDEFTCGCGRTWRKSARWSGGYDLVVELTGDCEVDCQSACAYPGQFSECDTTGTGPVS